ncbi:MAG: hypothetical protein DBY05_00840 [Clostridiales bacterium]|nr:MAG: hypothetical protein DBY05_00840 [Clostridiales bacterium]
MENLSLQKGIDGELNKFFIVRRDTHATRGRRRLQIQGHDFLLPPPLTDKGLFNGQRALFNRKFHPKRGVWLSADTLY